LVGLTSLLVNSPDAASTFARNLFAALAELGVRRVFVSPGSRSAPLALAADADPRLAVTMVLDERSAGFAALGAAKLSGDTTCVVSTSGTAAAHYHPAVVEALQARVPLLVITADRPPELVGTGAPQTIDQIQMFGDHVKLFVAAAVPDEHTAVTAADVAVRLFAAAIDQPPGSVHLNVPFREPLIGTPRGEAPAIPRHYPAVPRLQPEGLTDLARSLSGARAIVVAGGRQRQGFGAAAALFAASTGIPLIADPQCRYPTATTVAGGDLLASAGIPEVLEPDVVLRLGAIPTSKALWQWLSTSGVEQLWVDDGSWRDPLGTADAVYRADPAATLAELAGSVETVPAAWTRLWLDADRVVREAAHSTIAAEAFPNEPGIAAAVVEYAVDGSVIYAGSSMPIRDVDTFGGIPQRGTQVLANRGANGIDGTLSAAAGAAMETSRAYAIVGDIAALHDIGALGLIINEGLAMSIVVVNNDGGGIFNFLPAATDPSVEADVFERVFATPHGLALDAIAVSFGMPARAIRSRDELMTAIANPPHGPELLELRTDRSENVAVHERIRAAVAAALDAWNG